ncbi:TonB-dependent receptor [Sphingomonas parva]|uniref:TonB-dependent receptor n=1 Tax=Sphingomonas parva TaxID=2555898 RepID=A0A4Y8ZWY8_9SPHN|nr:TonB-dependent receptor [Sphingomonas parva]TFI59006.1 TonB-dependent receptor [Sphingomonas parva]
MSFASKARLLTSSLLIGAASFAAPAFAQTGPVESENPAGQSATDTAGEDQGSIVVTGSRIVRPEVSASVPVAVLSDEGIQASGAANLQDALSELPSVGQNISRTSTNFSTTANGQASVNLRNLGSARTLVLVDGRRFVAGLPGTSIVDINTIPTDLIERVEVVTGGASAVYGSEAIAGVVNFVLNDDFEGVRVRGQGTISDEGDAARQYVSVTAGTGFAGGRGNIIAYGQYDRDEGLRSRNRAFSATDVPNRSSFSAQGLFSPDGSFAPGASTFTFDQANNLIPYQSANINGYNRNYDRYLAVPVERYLGTLLGKFEVTDGIELFVEGEYAKTKSRSSLEPQAVANTDLTNPDGSVYAGIPLTNPFIPLGIRNAVNALNTDADPDNDVTAIPFRRRSNDIFDRSNRNDRELWRGVIGLRGELGNGYKWDVYYNHGESKDHTASETILGPNYVNSLNAVAGPNGPVCSINVDADPTNNDPNCVPINIFGFNTATPAASNYVTAGGLLSTYDAKVKQDVVAATISGSVLDLPGGPLGFATGVEYRREKSTEDFDEATNLGLTLGNFLSDTRGKYNVKEGFVEIVAPILADRTGFHYLGLEGAVRYADYSTVGGVWSWKAGGEYAPTRDIRFRAIYSEATRAPSISELFSAQSETFLSVIDPCDQRAGEGDNAPIAIPAGQLPAACLAVPAIAAASQTAGGFVYSTAQLQNINGFLGGNPNLQEETAKTLTAGAVFTPTFLRNFTLSVDYYRIKVQDAIGIIGQQTSLDECITGSGEAIFCGNIVRDATGRVVTVNALNLNTGSFFVEGIDTQARYNQNIGPARLDLSVYWNHLLEQEQTSVPGGPTQGEVGQLDCYNCGRLGTGFKDKVFASATVAMENWSLNWRTNWYSSVVDDLTDPDPIKTGDFWYHDAQLRFTAGDAQKLEFYLGVNNIFDKKPPLFGDTNLVTFPGTQTSANTYDLFGRMLYAGVDFRF